MKKLAEEEKVNYATSNSEVVEKSKYLPLNMPPETALPHLYLFR